MSKRLLHRRPIWRWVTLAALAAGLAVALTASGANLPGSNFEIDDGNLIVNGAAPALDWANVNEQRQTDTPSGQNDNSFTQGAKEDTPVPVVDTGSIPNSKSDLLNFGVYLEENAAGRFLNLFWRRVQEPNGTTNMDFEFNKSKVVSANGVTPVRTSGDVLIQYDLSQGGTNPTLWASRWIDGSEGGTAAQCQANNALPCWQTRVNLTTAGIATGSINLVPITAADSDGLGAMSARTFGEAQVNLDALQGGGGPQCSVFGSAYLKSRSSDSFNAELKDFIAPESVDLDQCATVIIRKVTDPVSDPATVQFGYTKSINTAPASANTFTLGHGQNKTYDNVLIGNGYTVDETSLPTGWDFFSLDCSASTGVTPTISGHLVTFNIDNKDDILDCTYTNRARGTIIVQKITDDGFGPFSFTSGTLTPSPFVLTTTAAGDAGKDARTFPNLIPGTYDVAETVPANWNLVSSSCSDGSNPSSIGLSGGETVTCTFHDARERGAIEITKTRKHAAAGGSAPHAGVTFTVTGGELPAAGVTAVTGDNGKACVDGLLDGSYTVTETVPAGYHAAGANPKTATVTDEATCASGPKAGVSFVNTPLTNITLSVDSQVDGGTASTINCGDGPVSTGANGDGSKTRNDLEPGTYTCTVVIDP